MSRKLVCEGCRENKEKDYPMFYKDNSSSISVDALGETLYEDPVEAEETFHCGICGAEVFFEWEEE